LKGRDTFNFSLMPGDEDVKIAFRGGILAFGPALQLRATIASDAVKKCQAKPGVICLGPFIKLTSGLINSYNLL